MKINLKELEEKLQGLTGNDFDECERAERESGNYSPTMSYSAGFQARLAAKALHTNIHELKALPLNEYFAVTTKVMNFLAAFLASDTIGEPEEPKS